MQHTKRPTNAIKTLQARIEDLTADRTEVKANFLAEVAR